MKAGFPPERWTLPRVAQFSQRTWGSEYHPASLSQPLHHLGFSAHLPRTQARERDDAHMEAWLKRTIAFLDETGSTFRGHLGRDDETYKRDGFDKVHELFWLNVLGPKPVEGVGRERMRSTPTLRPDLDFDTLLRTLSERSAARVPVEPRFHPDVAPLLARLPDEFAISERQRKIAELNAFRPPEPEEWLPVAHPSDVADPGRDLESYWGTCWCGGWAGRGGCGRRWRSPRCALESASGCPSSAPAGTCSPASHRWSTRSRGSSMRRSGTGPGGGAVEPVGAGGGGDCCVVDS